MNIYVGNLWRDISEVEKERWGGNPGRVDIKNVG
jgi:hypothetical protein